MNGLLGVGIGLVTALSSGLGFSAGFGIGGHLRGDVHRGSLQIPTRRCPAPIATFFCAATQLAQRPHADNIYIESQSFKVTLQN